MVKERKLNIVSSLAYLSDFFAVTADKMKAGTATGIEVALADSFLHYDQYSEGGDVANVMVECEELYGSNPLEDLTYTEYPESVDGQADMLQSAAEAITRFCKKLPEKSATYNVKTTLFISNKPSELTGQYEPFPTDAEFSMAYDD